MNDQPEVRRYTRSRSKRQMLNVDLNAVPPSENRDHDGTSNATRLQDRQAVQEGNSMMPPTIDLEALVDDDVIISSPSAFAEAKNNSRRNRRTVVVDVELEERPHANKRRKVPTNQTIINCDLYINLEGSSNSTRKKSGQSEVVRVAPPPLPPKEPTFNCPICMGPLVEEMTTKCGHIFCKACIKAAIAVQTKCPTCRRRTTAKDIIRVYLPSTRSS